MYVAQGYKDIHIHLLPVPVLIEIHKHFALEHYDGILLPPTCEISM